MTDNQNLNQTQPNWMITTRQRLRTQLNLSMETRPWREVIYNPDIDRLLAETALDDEDAEIAEQAARTIGRIRSQVAVEEIAQRQRKGERGALRALALVRDEAQSLPKSVSVQARIYAWLANTWRRLTLNPMQAVWRLLFGIMGTWLAISVYVWVQLPALAIFDAERWGKSVAWGLTTGVFMGAVVLFSAEFPARLRGFWPWWACVIMSGLAGLFLGALTWGAFTWLFLNYAIEWNWMLFGALGLAVAFILTTLFYKAPGWVMTVITAVCVYIPLYITWNNYWNDPALPAVIYFREYQQVYTQLPLIVLTIAIGAHAQALARDVRRLVKRAQTLRLRTQSSV